MLSRFDHMKVMFDNTKYFKLVCGVGNEDAGQILLSDFDVYSANYPRYKEVNDVFTRYQKMDLSIGFFSVNEAYNKTPPRSICGLVR
jgi:hypothetical protein